MSDVRVVFEETSDPLGVALRRLQRAILLHPLAAQALFYAFVEEGRAHAKTAEGAVWLERLRDSELIIRGRVVWDALTVRALEDNAETILPTAVLEALVKATADAGMERLAESLFLDSPLFGGKP